MTFTITVYGQPHEILTDHEKERLAEAVHDLLQEDFGVHPDSVGVEGYGKGWGR